MFLGVLTSCSGSAAIASSWPGLSVDEQTAYLAYNQHIYAINLTNGSEKWRFPAESNVKISFFSTPVLTPDGQLLAGSYNNVLYSINPANGTENWTFTDSTQRYVASPLVAGDTIYAPTAGDRIYALDLKGNLKWTFTGEGPFWAQPVAQPDCACLYLTSMGHYIYAINTVDGTLNWKSDKLKGSIVGTPVLDAQGNFYFGSFASELLQADPKTHAINTLLTTEGWIWNGPALFQERLYFGDLKGTFYSYDLTTKNIVWSVKPDGPVIGTPLVTEDAVYFGTESGTVYAYDLQGNIRWNKSYDGSVYTTPVIAGDNILVTLFKADKLLVALDMNGNELWSYTPAK